MIKIEERAKWYAPEYDYDSDITLPNYEISDIKRESFIEGAKSEHEELTKWHDVDETPEESKFLLTKIKDNEGLIVYVPTPDIPSILTACELVGGQLIGWRYIIDEDM